MCDTVFAVSCHNCRELTAVGGGMWTLGLFCLDLKRNFLESEGGFWVGDSHGLPFLVVTDITLRGLEIGLLTMKKGEVARFVFTPVYAYGQQGCPPLIPPNATVLFEVEMLDFLDSADSDAFFALTAVSCLNKAWGINLETRPLLSFPSVAVYHVLHMFVKLQWRWSYPGPGLLAPVRCRRMPVSVPLACLALLTAKCRGRSWVLPLFAPLCWSQWTTYLYF